MKKQQETYLTKRFWIGFFFFLFINLTLAFPFFFSISPFGKYYGIEEDFLAPDLLVMNGRGERISLSSLNADFYFFYFGYLDCETLCPLHMGQLYQISGKIPKGEGAFVYVSLAPRRDSEDKVLKYVSGLGKDFFAIREDLEKTREISRKFKVFNEDESLDQFDHTDSIFLADKDLRVRLRYLTAHSKTEKIIEDLENLRKTYRN
ncbi:MAG: SCO family protein [Leptospiraceae bacterium]|nr:SCO family protein [Leptospiraceae bacterium]MCP5510416.1 SCO family protein [Leptospiraceae bacterium]